MIRYHFAIKLLDNSIKYIVDEDLKDLGSTVFKDIQKIKVVINEVS